MFRPVSAMAALSAAALFTLPCVAEDAPEAPAPEAPAPEAAAAEAPAPAEADPAVIVIGGKPAVLRSELDARVKEMLARSPFADAGEEFLAMMRPNVARQLAMQRVLLDEAKARGIAVTAEDRAAAMEEFGITNLAQIAEEAGVPLESVEKDFSEGLLCRKLIESAVPAPELTDEQVRARFDEIVAAHPEAAHMDETVRASHILVRVDKDASEEEVAAARAKIDAARKRVLDGEDFAAVAADVSDCPSSAKGGDLGEFPRHGVMDETFSETAFAQEVGAVGEPVRTPFGFHVIRVAERTPARDVTFEEVREMLRSGMAEEAVNEARGDFLDGLMEKANVEFVGLDMEAPVAGPFQFDDEDEAAEEPAAAPAEEPAEAPAEAPAAEAPTEEPAETPAA